MILKLITVLYGPVLGFTAVSAWRAGRQFTAKANGEKKQGNETPPNTKVTPNIPKAVISVPTA